MMSCHIPLEELRRLQRRSTDADAPVLTTPAAEEASGEVAPEAVVAAVGSEAAAPSPDAQERSEPPA